MYQGENINMSTTSRPNPAGMEEERDMSKDDGDGDTYVDAQSIGELIRSFYKTIHRLNTLLEHPPLPLYGGGSDGGGKEKGEESGMEVIKNWLTATSVEVERGHVLAEYASDLIEEQSLILSSGRDSNFHELVRRRRVFLEKLKAEFDPLSAAFDSACAKLKTVKVPVEAELAALIDDQQMFGGANTTATSTSAALSPRTPPGFIALGDIEDGDDGSAKEKMFQIDAGMEKMEDADMDDLAADINELSEIAAEVAKLTRDQQTSLDDMEQNVDTAKDASHQAVSELRTASKLKSRILLPIGLTVAGALIGGPVGAVLGAKSGMALALSSGVGAGLGGFMSKKIQKAHERSVDDVVAKDEDEGEDQS